MFTPAPELWPPQRRGLVSAIATLEAGKSVCLYGPTGSGKTRLASELLKWGLSENRLGIFYLNRRLLIPQTAEAFGKVGVNCGIRAAGYDDCVDHFAPVQIASADTEASRVFSDDPSWEPHPAKLVVIDEFHLQKSQVMRKIIDYYKSQGAYIVGLTATPVGLSKWVDELVISGKLQEFRDAGALVPAKVYSICQPDMAKVKRNLTGEFILDGRAKQVYTQTIVGDVIDSFKDLNPNADPTMMFAPGVPESVWLVEQFGLAGFRFCHVDATDYILDGKRAALNRKAWLDIIEQFKAGKIVGLSTRFKCREGVDLPFAKHAIFATPIGSIASWIQSAGRVLRASPGKQFATIQDHGGNYHRFGSPNHDQPWDRLWDLPERAASEYHRLSITDGSKPEPICCPSCKMERSRGSKCPGCGFECDRSKRKVVMENGKMIEVDGPLMKPRRAVLKKDTEKKWEQLYWAFKNKGVDRSFNQMWAYFFQQYGYPPPRDMKLCPKEPDGWYRRPSQVPMNELIGKG